MSRNFKEFQRKVENRKFAIDNSWLGDAEQTNNAPVTTQAVGEWYHPQDLPWNTLNDNILEADACKYFDGYLPIESKRKWVLFLKKAMRKLIKIFLGWYIFPQYQRMSHFHGKVVNAISLERDILMQSIKQNQILANKIGEQESQLDSLRRQLQQVDVENKELRLQLKKLQDLPTDDDDFYHAFEEKFRGSQEDIKNRLQVYVPKLKEHLQDWSKGTFVDVGSGRGEWLDILRENGATDYVGVDLNARQNALCEERGHKVVQMDCIAYLASLPENSVDLVTGFQIIEHLCMPDLMELLKESYRVLKKGGMILFETQNPRNLVVGADTFYIDPSHKRPLEPRMVAFFAEWCGYGQVRCIDANSAPCSAAFNFPDIGDKAEEYQLIKEFNDMKWLLYGPQDYAVFGVKE